MDSRQIIYVLGTTAAIALFPAARRIARLMIGRFRWAR